MVIKLIKKKTTRDKNITADPRNIKIKSADFLSNDGVFNAMTRQDN